MPNLDAPISVEITVRLSQPHYGGGALHLSEILELPATDFLGLAKIMGQFHALAISIREEADKAAKAKR